MVSIQITKCGQKHQSTNMDIKTGRYSSL